MTNILASAKLVQALSEQISAHVKTLDNTPELHVILVGENPASHLYVKRKQQSAAAVGIDSALHHVPEETTQEELNALITSLAEKHSVTGLLLQLPLPKHLNAYEALNLIPAQKDVDGLTDANKENLTTSKRHISPATPLGIMRILQWVGIDLAQTNAVVLGESHLVGAPTAQLLASAGAAVRTFNSGSDVTAKHNAMKNADLIVSAAGRLNLVTPENTSAKATVIDVGINKTPEGKIRGDGRRDLDGHISALTPVPGGVGPMTVMSLLTNVIDAAAWQAGSMPIQWTIPARAL